MPLTALEALALQKPCVLSRVEGHGDLEEFCELYEHGNAKSLYDSLKKATPYEGFPSKFKRESMAKSLQNTYLNMEI